MIETIITLTEFDRDEVTKTIWSWILTEYSSLTGFIFYKHPIITTPSNVTPEITFITKELQPLIMHCLPYQITDIDEVTDTKWKINGEYVDSPLLVSEDFIFVLKAKFDRDRLLRRRLSPINVIALLNITESQFNRKFPCFNEYDNFIWKSEDINLFVKYLNNPLSDDEWEHVISIIQGASPLKKGPYLLENEVITLGDAIKNVDRKIAFFDKEQAKAALEIAPGPQRIRGLAGTGKTVLLAMKAANVHLRYPYKKILFTFQTQTLYNQIRDLITKFYRFNSDIDPDWDMLHIRHAWGGSYRSGVYSDICETLRLTPLSLSTARQLNKYNPFSECCKQVLNAGIIPEYDFIMVDEAQDFPSDFFQVLFFLSKPPHQIYWVYDDLQSLTAKKMPIPENLFGYNKTGIPNVSLKGDSYPGGIEKDLVLHHSYRCPLKVLMLAHAIGLGLYSEDGCVQILSSKESWEGNGYIVESGELVEGQEVTLLRPYEYSPNPITDIYKGDQDLIQIARFNTREDELNWIANSIFNDIKIEKVDPEKILVICLDPSKRTDYLLKLQKYLNERDLPSTIPGLIDDSASFAIPGRVTLSTVFRAKGNETYIVYIFCFEGLYHYSEALQNRNQAFTSISRSKAWVRITGIGNNMEKAEMEVNRILSDIPRFKFIFPNLDNMRNLDAETDRRRREVEKGKESIIGLIDLSEKAIAEIAEKDPDLFKKLYEQLEKVKQK